MFMDYSAMQSCTSGRAAFLTGMYPVRVGLTVPQLPGSPAWIRQGTPTLAKMLLDLGYTTGQFGKNHLGDHTESLPTAQGFQEYWGYLYHLDAVQQVSFPDINKTPTEQGIAPPCRNTPIPGMKGVPGAVDPIGDVLAPECIVAKATGVARVAFEAVEGAQMPVIASVSSAAWRGLQALRIPIGEMLMAVEELCWLPQPA